MSRLQSPARQVGLGVDVPLLPFLDIVFAIIGIFVLVFAFQIIEVTASARQTEVNQAVLCVQEGEYIFYAGPHASPERFGRFQTEALFAQITAAAGDVANIVFAFTADCLATRRSFNRAYRKFARRLEDREDGQVRRIVRLAYWPLRAADGAEAAFLRRWHGGEEP